MKPVEGKAGTAQVTVIQKQKLEGLQPISFSRAQERGGIGSAKK